MTYETRQGFGCENTLDSNSFARRLSTHTVAKAARLSIPTHYTRAMSDSTEKCIAGLRKHYTTTNCVGFTDSQPPIFYWPHSLSGPVKTTNPWVKAHWYINVYLSIGYLCFVVYRTVQAYNDPNQTLDQQRYLVLMSVLYAFGTFYSSSTLFKCEEFIQFQRSHVKFVRDGETMKLAIIHLANTLMNLKYGT